MPEIDTVRTPVAGRRQLALWLLCAASLMIIFDGTIFTVALPSIQRQLGFSAAGLSWVVNAYLIAFGSLLLLAGRLGDLIGRKRMYLAGLAAFTTARAPLLPLRPFAVRELAGANLAQLLVIAAAFGFQVMITLYMQRVLGYGAAASGLGLLPTAVVIGAVALGLSARIAGRFGPRVMLLAGLGLVTAGLALLTQVPVHASYPAQLLPALLIFGAGGGLCLPGPGLTGYVGCHARRRRHRRRAGRWLPPGLRDRRGAGRGVDCRGGRGAVA